MEIQKYYIQLTSPFQGVRAFVAEKGRWRRGSWTRDSSGGSLLAPQGPCRTFKRHPLRRTNHPKKHQQNQKIGSWELGAGSWELGGDKRPGGSTGEHTHLVQLRGPRRGGGAPSAVAMCDDSSMRYCKAFLRRRLAYGPQVLERGKAASHPDGGGELGASAWGHLWPLGRHTQCEELRRVRDKETSILVGGFVGV